MSRKKTTQPVTKLKGRDKLSGELYEFSVINDELLLGVPDQLKSTVDERIDFFRHIQTLLAARKNEPVASPETLLIDVPFVFLERCSKGRVKPDINNVARLVLSYHAPSRTAATVVCYPIYDEYGTLQDVKYEASDHWHSSRRDIEVYYRDKPEKINTDNINNMLRIGCAVSIGASVADSALSSVNANASRGKKPFTSTDTWRGRAASKDYDPPAAAAVSIGEHYGFDMSAERAKAVWPALQSGSVIETLLFKPPFSAVAGESVVRRTLSLLSNPENINVYGIDETLSSSFIGGFALFIGVFEKFGYAHALGIEHMLRTCPCVPKTVDRMVESISKGDVKKILGTQYSWGQREQNQRYAARAVALWRLYVDFLSTYSAREANPHRLAVNILKSLAATRDIKNERRRKRAVTKLHEELRELIGEELATWPILGAITR